MTTQKATKTFDYTTIADLLQLLQRQQPNWCGSRLRDPILPTNRKSCVFKRTKIDTMIQLPFLVNPAFNMDKN